MYVGTHSPTNLHTTNQLTKQLTYLPTYLPTDYGLDGPGIESQWGRDFPPIQTSPGAHPASCTMGTSSFPGVKCGLGVLLTTHPLLTPRSWKS